MSQIVGDVATDI
jgi:hypothetical protein